MPKPTNHTHEARNGLKWDSLQETLDSGTDAARKGAQQFFTPQEFARAFMAPIPMAQRRAHAVDLEMGAAALLLASRSEHLMGSDVDKSVAHKPDNAPGFWSAYHNDPRRCSWTDFTTKSAAILGALVEILGRGEQALIASPFQHFNATLHKRLRDSGVTTCLCDGTVSAQQRGKMAAAFKQFRYSVMVAGEKAMGEGNSFEQCTNLFLPSLDWAFDINDQTTDRVHRLTSTQPVHIYTCITDNTVDERLYSLYCEKGDSSHLALDGRLFEERTEEVNLAQLLRDAVRDFNPHASTIDEQQVEDEWSALSQKLRIAEQQFREFHPPIAEPLFAGADASVCRVTAEDVRAAIAALADRPRKPRAKAKPVPKPALRFAEDDATAAQIRALLDQIESETI